MSGTSIGLDGALQRYLLDVSLREPAICRRLREQTSTMEQSAMLSSPEQVQLLLLLLRMLDARRMLEIGTFTGYTSLRLTLGIPRLRMTCCDIDEEFADIARGYWGEAGVRDRIDLYLAPAIETLDRLLADGAADAYDCAYVDADKESYVDYVERSLRLVRPGGLVAIDNTLWRGAVVDPDEDDEATVAVRRFNEWVRARDEAAFDLSMVPIGDGLTLLRRLPD